MDFLFLLYWIIGVIFAIYTIRITRLRGVNSLSVVNAFYTVIYFVMPASVCQYICEKNYYDIYPVDTSPAGRRLLVLLLVMATVDFILINFGYRLSIGGAGKRYIAGSGSVERVGEYSNVSGEGYAEGIGNESTALMMDVIERRPGRLRIAAFSLMMIGTAALLLWTHVFGGPVGILPYANALRAGRDTGIYNPFSFFMKLVPFAQFALYLFFSLFMSKKKPVDLVLFILSGITTGFYILAISSRMHFILVFVVIFLIFSMHKKLTRKVFIIMGIIFVAALILMHSAEAMLDRFQYGRRSSVELSFDVLSIIRDEFSYIIASFQTAFTKVVKTGEEAPRIINDLIAAVFAWLPTRFRPEWVTSLEGTNTVYIYGTTLYGGMPTDFVSTCIYELGIAGIFIFPIIYGMLMKKFDTSFKKLISGDYYKVIYILGCFYFMKAVAYGEYANVMSNIFTLVWGHIFVKLVCVGYRKRMTNVKKSTD